MYPSHLFIYWILLQGNKILLDNKTDEKRISIQLFKNHCYGGIVTLKMNYVFANNDKL